jgi:predicted transcriptional regulator
MSSTLTVPGLPVDPDLSRRLKRNRLTRDRALEERDRLILEAHDAGASLREIAVLVGLTHVGVRNVINAHRGGPMDHTEGRNLPGPQE